MKKSVKNKMCSKKYNETFNDEVRWTSGGSSSRKKIIDTSDQELLLLASAQPTVTSIKHRHMYNNQSSSVITDKSNNTDKSLNFINSIRHQQKFKLNTQKNNKSILYQLIALTLVLINSICNNLLLTTLLPCVSADELMDAPGARGHYTPTWAVHIPGGDHIAQQVADDHGYVLLGKIIDEHYHFHHNSVSKRSISPSNHHQSHLDTDDRVRWSQQQRAKSRQKRDYVKPNRQSSSSRYNNLLNDPKWPSMWYLNRGSGLDMNVIPAWKEGITGRGVVVTILDDGLESDHPDLVANYDPKASYDVNSHDDDPTPHYDMTDSNRHGTRCAGEVAATANNSECAVGIAYGARVGGVRMLDGDVTDAVEARSLSLNPQHIDIYSASWGPDDDGKTVDGPGEMATRAFIEGITKGRGGRGSIFIWASGNGGREHDNCNCDGYTNSIWTLSISSATEDGLVPWYSEMCSSTLATTYSSGGMGEKQVVTTDLHHSCTTSHTGTSASAPLAAGIAALVLEANSNLTWRDLQHIVVRTAKPGNLKDPSWSKNGVGRRVSHSFGYGLMDAVAMVRLARTWKTVPDQQRCEINAPHLDRQIPPKSRLKLQLTVQHCKGVNYLEHVQAKITLTSQRRGDIQIYLTSPAGTKVTLLTSRSHDVSRAGFNNWPFMSVHTWGEAPHGHWQLEIFNEGRYMAQITQWELIFYGTDEPPQPGDPPRFGFDKQGFDSEAYDGEIGQNVLEFEPGTAGQWRDIQQVDNNRIDVSQRTASNDITGSACRNYSTDSKCIECIKDIFLYKGRCFKSCPEGSYIVPEIAPIDKVPQKREKSVSLRYAGEEASLSEMGDVKAELVIGSSSSIQKLCDSCHFSCSRCHGPDEAQCNECVPNYLFIRIDNETFCKPPPFDEKMDEEPELSFIRRLNGNELILLGGVLGVLVFIVILGGYFFFRDVCCSKLEEYTYNPLNDDDQEMGRQTINRKSAVAFKKQIQRNDDSSSSDEDTEIYRSRNYDKR